jgi:hypothetical protein
VDGKTLFWLLLGAVVGSYLCKEMGVDCFQLFIDGCNAGLEFIQTHASKQGVV